MNGYDAWSRPKEGVVYYAGINSEHMDGVFAPQSDTLLCWAACVGMILRNQGIYVSQRVIYNAVFGDKHCDTPYNCAANEKQMCISFNLDGNDKYGNFFSIRSDCNKGFPNFERLISELANDNPVVIAYHATRKIGHAILITGVKYFYSNGMIYLQEIIIRDPEMGDINVFNNGRKVITRTKSFVENTYGFWIPDVYTENQQAVVNSGFISLY